VITWGIRDPYNDNEYCKIFVIILSNIHPDFFPFKTEKGPTRFDQNTEVGFPRFKQDSENGATTFTTMALAITTQFNSIQFIQ